MVLLRVHVVVLVGQSFHLSLITFSCYVSLILAELSIIFNNAFRHRLLCKGIQPNVATKYFLISLCDICSDPRRAHPSFLLCFQQTNWPTLNPTMLSQLPFTTPLTVLENGPRSELHALLRMKSFPLGRDQELSLLEPASLPRQILSQCFGTGHRKNEKKKKILSESYPHSRR